MQVPPQREQRDEQPDAARGLARLGAQQQDAGGEQRQREELARIATIGPKQAGTSSSSAIASARSCAPDAPRVAREQRQRPGDGRDLGDLHAAAPERRRAARTRARRAPARWASRRSAPRRRARRRGSPPRLAIVRPSSASQGPSAACTLSSAAKAVTASTASPPGRASARSGSPRRGRALIALNLVEARRAAPVSLRRLPTERARHPHAQRRRRAPARALAARDGRARGHGPAPARPARARAARERGRDGRGRVPRRRRRRQRRLGGSRAAPRARLAAAGRARAARRLVGAGRARRLRGARPQRAARGRHAHRASRSTRSLELDDVRLGTGLVKLAAVSGIGALRAPAHGPAARRLHARALRGRADRRHAAAAGGRVRRPPRRRRHGDARPRSCLSARRARDAVHRRRHPAPSRCCCRRASAASRAAAAAAVLAQLRLDGRARPGLARTSGTSTACSPRRAGREARLTAANGQFGLTAPDDALVEARSAGRTASRRVLLVGGAAAVLLLAFAGLTAGALRRDVRAELRRLGQRGATLSQQAAFVLAEALSAVLPGRARRPRARHRRRRGDRAARGRARRPPRSRTASRRPRALALVAAGALGALAVVALALRRPGRPPAGGHPARRHGGGRRARRARRSCSPAARATAGRSAPGPR